MAAPRMLRVATVVIAAAVNVAGKKAADIARVRTKAPGPWPQQGVVGCGNTGLPPSGILAECTEALHPDAPDLRGYWIEDGEEEDVGELIEMCGSRWIDISKPVVHDHPSCDGTLAGGVEDYSGPNIVFAETSNDNVDCRGLCTPITTAGKFELDEQGNKCVNLYTDVFGFGSLTKVVSRCLQPDGTMIWVHPVIGTVKYRKVPRESEPDCVTCPDGTVATRVTDVLSCSYEERRWIRCNATKSSLDPPPSLPDGFDGSTCQPSVSPINGPLIVGIAAPVLAIASVLCCVVCKRKKMCCFKVKQPKHSSSNAA